MKYVAKVLCAGLLISAICFSPTIFWIVFGGSLWIIVPLQVALLPAAAFMLGTLVFGT